MPDNTLRMYRYTLALLQKFITANNLKLHTNITAGYFRMQLENTENFLGIYYSVDFRDAPNECIVCFCKTCFFNRENVLYSTDTPELVPLWAYDNTVTLRIGKSFQEDSLTLKNCCEVAIRMFADFQALSNERYKETAQKLLASARASIKNGAKNLR